MEAKYSYYDYEKSIERIDEILNSSDASYEDRNSIPSRDLLTFTNGYYVDASVIFIDMRGSKVLAEKHTRPVLAKMYRTFISELVAVLRGDSNVFEIYIEGDAVWGVFDTPTKNDIDRVFSTAAQASSLVDILNIKLNRRNYTPVGVGIGLAYGQSLLIKAGYRTSGVNEVVWIGKVVGEAAKLCDLGGRLWTNRTFVSNVFYDNLNESNRKLLNKDWTNNCYSGYIVNTTMNEWVNKNG
ncbi:adenylate/guanylate cyclase domain-containing protein [Massilia niastensis]|uniref:adenylate/guanylate cyclase domain-containing protein n=1 Tax=Massilia niastensis TaxID=544911 RepID=UPI0003810930|nr:adenylate/guanylate cyclase domain-containing protein [Massilia niastensis]